MSASLSNNSLRLSSPLKVEEEAHIIHKQGIVSILRSDCERSKVMSLRRTLSADMSKWLAHDDHHRHPMKKIASSQEFPISSTPPDLSSSEEEEDDWNNHHLERRSQSDVWRSIQKEKERKEMEKEKAGQFDIWSSILCQKAEEDSASKLQLPPPYIHPLVKRSSSSLTEKSLEICTESLGSETGADGFSSYSASEIGDTEDEGDQVVSSQPQPQPQPQQQLGGERESLSFDRDEYRGLKYNRKFPPPLRSFPPPLPSLSSRDTSLHMHSRRENGRLVLEAVSVPSRNCFRAQRQDGRLRLTLVNSPSQEPIHDNHEEAIDEEEDKVEEFEEVFENEAEIRSEEDYEEEEDDEDEDEDEEEMFEKEYGGNEMGIVREQGVPKLLSGVINVHRSAPMMKKLMGIENRINSPWGTPKFNKSVNLIGMDVEEDEEEVANPLPQSLPPPTRVTRLIQRPPATVTATSFNAYEYFSRTKPAGVATMMGPLTQPCPPLKNSCNKAILSNSSPKAYRQQDLVLYRGNKADCLVPLLGSGCKEPKRSLLIWEPYCIATS